MKPNQFLLICSSILFIASSAFSQSPKDKAEARKRSAISQDANAPDTKPFAVLTKDAQVTKGLFTFYRKDDKVYLEILPEQFDRMYLCSPTLESGIGERGLLSAQMLEEFVFTLHRQDNNVQLLRKNVRYRATAQTPIQRAVARSFADSVLASAKIESQPHPKNKSVLVDLKGLFQGDIPLLGFALESIYRWPYKLDPGNSAFGSLKGFPDNCEVEALLNFSIERPPVPPLKPPPEPQPKPPLAPPDPRSLPFRVRYSLSTLPETTYRPRLADDRVGHFMAMFQDFTDDKSETPYVRYVTRWQLEKADPNAPLSPPKQPIVFWLENAMPVKYRQAITDGVLLWNKAFERIGFKDAVVVKQQPDNADWYPADVRYNTIRWFVATDAGFAIGPSRINPFTGQIYDADISFSESMTRFIRHEYEEFVQPKGAAPNAWQASAFGGRNTRAFCNLADFAASQAAFGFTLLQARGALASAEVEEKFVHDWLVYIAAHEVGHTLGLRHNFRASTLHPFEKLHDAALTKEIGLSSSVMDYLAVNLALDGQKQGEYWPTTIGPYDYWAIEYAYKPITGTNTDAERPELQKIAARASDPQLAYGTDEDLFGWVREPAGIDPRTNWSDWGDDPLPYYRERVRLVHELWQNLETKVAKSGEGYQILRRSFDRSLGELYMALFNTSKYISGIYHVRDHVGDAGQRSPYQPVPADKQRQALALLNEDAFGSKAFDLPPSLLNKLAAERFWTFEGDAFDEKRRLDYPIHDQVLALQRTILDRLYHSMTLARLQDLEVKYPDRKDAFTMADLFEGLRDGIWSETKTPGTAINSFRRALQREHLKRLIRLVLRPEPNTPEDATTLARFNLTQLRDQLQPILGDNNVKLDLAARAHLQESLARIDEALKAQQHRVVN